MKIELKSDGHHVHTPQLSAERNNGILFARALLRRTESIAITLLVFELQTIHRLHLWKQFGSVPFIKKQIEAATRRDPHVVVALWTDLGISFKIRSIQDRVALGAFAPKPFWNISLGIPISFTHTRGNNFINPAHFDPLYFSAGSIRR